MTTQEAARIEASKADLFWVEFLKKHGEGADMEARIESLGGYAVAREMCEAERTFF